MDAQGEESELEQVEQELSGKSKSQGRDLDNEDKKRVRNLNLLPARLESILILDVFTCL